MSIMDKENNFKGPEALVVIYNFLSDRNYLSSVIKLLFFQVPQIKLHFYFH